MCKILFIFPFRLIEIKTFFILLKPHYWERKGMKGKVLGSLILLPF